METAILCWVNDKDGRHPLLLGPMLGSCFSEYHGHDGVLVRRTPSAMTGQGIFKREVTDDITTDNKKITGNEVPGIKISHGIADGHGYRFQNFELSKGRRWSIPF
jgi:hypothetical protein